MPQRLLIIGNKRYSSWSLRAWIALKQLGLPFQEHRIELYGPESKAEILRYSPAGKVPILQDNGITVYESLAILEYLNETHAAGALLPHEPRARAAARSIAAEMHAGFASLRQALPMNLGREPNPVPLQGEVRADILRILSMWEGARREHEAGGPYLFGRWSLADCMYLPVATRFHHYAVDLGAFPRARAYCETLLNLPAYREWRADALKETATRPEFEK